MKIKHSIRISLLSTVLGIGLYTPNSEAKNLHRIDPPAGQTKVAKESPGESVHKDFEIFRTGKPENFAQYEDLVCNQGISEIFVLSNNGDSIEKNFEKTPTKCGKKLTVKNFDQNVKKSPLTSDFLKEFNEWVKDARKNGKKIAFRCNCGCHRTGRLAGYYEMAFMGKKPSEVMKNMKKLAHGKPDAVGKAIYWRMISHKLKKQTEALYDYINNKPCSTREKFCVVTDPVKAKLAVGKNEPDYDDMTEEELAALERSPASYDNDDSKDIPATTDAGSLIYKDSPARFEAGQVE